MRGLIRFILLAQVLVVFSMLLAVNVAAHSAGGDVYVRVVSDVLHNYIYSVKIDVLFKYFSNIKGIAWKE